MLKPANNRLLDEEGTRPQLFYIDPDKVLKMACTGRMKGKPERYADLIS
jgi:hypothetical protein